MLLASVSILRLAGQVSYRRAYTGLDRYAKAASSPPQMSMDADGKGEKSTTTFRWINVARYAVASVVTVLIVTVVVIAVKMVLRPDTLMVRIVGGSISVVMPPGAPPDELQLVFTVQADNPSGRAVMYYYNITAYLFDNNISASTLKPEDDSFVWFGIANQTLQQQEASFSHTQVPTGTDLMTESYFDMLYNNRSARMDGVTMRMEGYLVTELISGYNKTARWTTYYCSPLVVGRAPVINRPNKNTQDIGLCAEIIENTVTSAR